VSLVLRATIRDRQACLGGTLRAEPDDDALARLVITGTAGQTAWLHGSDGAIDEVPLRSHHTVLSRSIPVGANTYLRAEVRDRSGRLAALTNPIWIEQPPLQSGTRRPSSAHRTLCVPS
jgi:hypothetical protein